MSLLSDQTASSTSRLQTEGRATRASSHRSRAAPVVVAAVGVALLVIGAALLGLAGVQRSEGGFFTSAAQTLATPTFALVTDEVLVEQGRPGNSAFDLGDLAEVRVRANAPADGQAIFIGIGRKADVDAYLEAVAHDRMVGFELEPFLMHYARTDGGPARTPAAEPFWVASETGEGGQDLVWPKQRGAWSAVAMNADGSPGVAVTTDLGLRFGLLLPLGLTLLAGGALVLAAAARVRRQRPTGSVSPGKPYRD